MTDFLIVGAGFAGAVIARVLADAGFSCHVIDKRKHVGGNAYDYIDSSTSVRVHKYGPHLFHASLDSPAVRFLSRFTEWIPYEHRVRALLPDGRTTPLPVNATTLEDIFNVKLESQDDARCLINNVRLGDLNVTNTDEYFLHSVGPELSNLFFRPYTKKMWGIDPSLLAKDIGSRLKVRFDRDDRYFLDDFQALPSNGYYHLFLNLLSHENISVRLNEPFMYSMLQDYRHSFLSIPIDEFYSFQYGSLPYRSILFHHAIQRKGLSVSPVVNFTDNSRYTRVTDWSMLSNSYSSVPTLSVPDTIVTREEPVALSLNPGEFYYPVNTADSRIMYLKYKDMAAKENAFTFIGRTGLFSYIDMAPCVNMHLSIAKSFLANL